MFCHSLRRRPSYASVVSKFTSPNAPLRLLESDLKTHDVELHLPQSTRKLRILLLSPSSADDANLDATLARVQRFAALTGGHDLTIVFLLATPPPAVTSAKYLATGYHPDACAGVLAFSKLQAEFMGPGNPDALSGIPMLPLADLDGLPGLLRSRLPTPSVRPPPPQHPPPPGPFDLLQLCTLEPPMPETTAFYLTDLFPTLQDLAQTCATPTAASLPHMDSSTSPPPASNAVNSASGAQQVGDAMPRSELQRLSDLVGEREVHAVVGFWRAEWTVE